MSNKSGTSSQIISLPQGGGALHGIGEKFSPDLHTGTGNFTVPIALPPGRNSFQPELNLVYSTGNGNGHFGMGWGLSVPGVMRKTSKGVPRYDDEEDTFVLSGAEDLIPVEQSPSLTRYQPRTEGLFARIEHHRDSSSNQNYWKVWSKDGLVSYYGTPRPASAAEDWADPAVIANPANRTNIFAWKLSRTEDLFGNLIEYDYERDLVEDGPHHWDQLYLKRIRYVDYGNRDNPQFLVSVNFVYADRPDPFSEYRAGFEIRATRRCTRIEIATHPGTEQLSRIYHLIYLDQRDDSSEALPINRASLLSQVKVEGQAENLLANSDFAQVGPDGNSTTFTGSRFAGRSAAADWTLYNNTEATTTSELLPSTFSGRGTTMLHVMTTGQRNGLVQTFLRRDAGPDQAVASVWVYVKRGQVAIGTGNGGRTGLDARSTTTGQWEYLQAENGASPANQFIIYSASEGGAEFYVANAMVQTVPASESLPPLEFRYTQFQPEGRDFFPVKGQDLPARSLGNPEIELADLFGNGLPDILEMNGTVRYWRNLGNGRFALPQEMRDAPAGLQLADQGVQLIDANGDGRIDLLVNREGLSGYFPLKFGGLWDRRSFQRYEFAPSFDLEGPNVQLVDLTGDGVTDVIRSGSRLECFFNDPEQGWTETRRVERRAIADFPNINFSDPRVKWGDMTGDGLQDILLVYDGNIEYWPNLGYGKWGKRISMRNSPRYRYGYDPRRILIGDIDGDGLDDVIYVDDRKVILWINQSGNGWSNPIEIKGTPPVTDTDAIRLVDLLGTGISGILWSADVTGSSRHSMYFLDFTGGVKPYLLNQMDNRMGAVTRVGYVPSTSFYLEDEQRLDTQWKTPLPFPVQVVSRVEVIDQISRGKLTTQYHYHHGYWDGAEREFRGFGMVEQWDTEGFDDYDQPGLHGKETPFQPVDPVKHFSPPMLTKTWFHQGPVGEEFGDWYELEYDDYWAEDPQVLQRPESVQALLRSLPRRAKRDAYRALRGRILRTELYALDGTGRQNRPYTVTESIHGVRSVSPPSAADPDRQRIFFPFSLAQRTTQWERGAEPITQFGFTEDYDDYGQPRSQISIAVPRGRDFRVVVPATAAPEPYLATQSTTTYAQRDDTEYYIVDRTANTTAYEISNDGSTSLFELKQAIQLGAVTRQVIGQTVNYYDGRQFRGLPFGQIGAYGALMRSELLVATEDILAAAYQDETGAVATPPYLPFSGDTTWTPDYPEAFREALDQRAGYRTRASGSVYAGGYYTLTERRRYDFQIDSDDNRGLVRVMLDPLGRVTRVAYDPYRLLPRRVDDPLRLITRARYDYRVLQPKQVIDPNSNNTFYAFTPLGLLSHTLIQGKNREGVGDTQDAPSVRLDYDFLAFAERRQPISVRTIQREHHVTETDVPLPKREQTIETVEYSDGFGRLVQTRTQGEDVRFGDAQFGNAVLPADQSETPGNAVGQMRDAEDPVNVVVSGWQIYDNKGRVVEKYEPFYGRGWDYQPPLETEMGQKVEMYYDPRGQVIRTVNPDGSEQRVIYGVPTDLSSPKRFTPTPWEAYTYDANDNAGRTHRDDTQVNARNFESHWNTPTSAVVDALGRTIETVERNGADPERDRYVTRSTYDIRGNLLTVTDALGREAFRYTYDLTPKGEEEGSSSQVLRIENIDAGVRRVVFDAMGNEIERRDSKGSLILQAYDPLNRPLRLWARDDADAPLTLRERLAYGDGSRRDQDPEERDARRAQNLLGKVYQHYDEAGRLTVERYDFKGNVLEKSRRVIGDAPILAVFEEPDAEGQVQPFRVDWQPPEERTLAGHAATLLDAADYRTSATYDALNRVKQMRYPQDVEGNRKLLQPQYNRAGGLERVSLDEEIFVDHIAYNAKGQRTLVTYGNGVMTRYAYDPETFRLVRLRSERYATTADPFNYRPTSADRPLQDFAYRYDLVGNILTLTDRTPESGFRDNPMAAEVTDSELRRQLASGDALIRGFEYDPIYRLKSATGRECDRTPESPPWADQPRCTDLTRTRGYQERYVYDAVGNIEQLHHDHFAEAGSPQRRTREFALVTDGSDGPLNNQLDTVTIGETVYDYRYDANGNLVQENASRHFEWDHSDRMKAFRIQAGAEPSVQAHYLYDASGQRVKKLVRKGRNQVEVTVYVDGVFEYHRLQQGVEVQENNTLHVMDDQQRIALVRVGEAFPGDNSPAVRYHLGDHLGSSNVVIGEDGSWVNREEFTPYGETSFGSFAKKRYRFTGKERDEESGLNYHGARYYSPHLIRWTVVDPIGIEGGINSYRYVSNNPLHYIDLSGNQETSAQEINIDANYVEEVVPDDPPVERPDFTRGIGTQAHADILPVLETRLLALGFPFVMNEWRTRQGGGRGGGHGEIDLVVGRYEHSESIPGGSRLVGHIYDLKPVGSSRGSRPDRQVRRYTRHARSLVGKNLPLEYKFGTVLHESHGVLALEPIAVQRGDSYRVYYLSIPVDPTTGQLREGFIEYTYVDYTLDEIEQMARERTEPETDEAARRVPQEIEHQRTVDVEDLLPPPEAIIPLAVFLGLFLISPAVVVVGAALSSS